MKKNQLTTTKSTAVILGRTNNLMNITKKLLEGSNKGLAKAKPSQDVTTHKDITTIGDIMWEKESKLMNWDDGMEYAKNLRLGGYDDWRLPTIEELGDIVTLCGGIFSAYDDENWDEIWEKNSANETYQSNYRAKGFVSYFYWSSTAYAGNSVRAWNVYVGVGGQGGNDKTSSLYVRCVRVGQ